MRKHLVRTLSLGLIFCIVSTSQVVSNEQLQVAIPTLQIKCDETIIYDGYASNRAIKFQGFLDKFVQLSRSVMLKSEVETIKYRLKKLLVSNPDVFNDLVWACSDVQPRFSPKAGKIMRDYHITSDDPVASVLGQDVVLAFVLSKDHAYQVLSYEKAKKLGKVNDFVRYLPSIPDKIHFLCKHPTNLFIV